jgi:acetyl esterase
MYYPVTDAAQDTDSYREFADGPFLTAKAMAWFWDNYSPEIEPRSQITASPPQATIEELNGLPPALVIVDEKTCYATKAEPTRTPGQGTLWCSRCLEGGGAGDAGCRR